MYCHLSGQRHDYEVYCPRGMEAHLITIHRGTRVRLSVSREIPIRFRLKFMRQKLWRTSKLYYGFVTLRTNRTTAAKSVSFREIAYCLLPNIFLRSLSPEDEKRFSSISNRYPEEERHDRLHFLENFARWKSCECIKYEAYGTSYSSYEKVR